MNFNTHIFGGGVIILAPNYSKAYPQTAEIYILFFKKKKKITIHTIKKWVIKESPTVPLDISVTEGGVLKRKK